MTKLDQYLLRIGIPIVAFIALGLAVDRGCLSEDQATVISTAVQEALQETPSDVEETPDVPPEEVTPTDAPEEEPAPAVDEPEDVP